MVHYLIQGQVNAMAETTLSDGTPLGNCRRITRDHEMTKTNIVALIESKRRIRRRNRGGTPQEGSTFDGRVAHC